MSWKQVAGRGTWLGAAVAALVLVCMGIYIVNRPEKTE